MRELRAVALSEDGGYLVLTDTAGGPDSEKFRVPVDDRLRALLRNTRRSEVRQESALTPREIQARLRAGETAAEVARVAGIPVERVERYEGPVLAERARVVQEARAALLPKDPGGAPGRPLGEVVDARLLAAQDDPESAQWDAWRRVDGIWLVQLTSETRCARWTWDPVVRRVRPHDDAARALVTPESSVDATASSPPLSTVPTVPTHQSVRPTAPALTLVQEATPVQKATPVHEATATAITPAPAAQAPATPAPPTPIQPAAARGRTHGAPRPAKRGEIPGTRPAAAPTPLLRPAAPGSQPRQVKQSRRTGEPTAAGPVPAAAAAAAAPTVVEPAAKAPPAAVAPPVGGIAGQATATPPNSKPTPPNSKPEAESGPDGDTAAGQPLPRGRTTPGRAPERGSGGKRGRKSVPAWDDIVFGARRP